MLKAAIFDLDGVITDTAVIHFRAWKSTFDEVMRSLKGVAERPFEHDADYVPFVDGKPRYDGVSTFLASRGIELPFGEPSDPIDTMSVCGVGNRKNGAFLDIVESGDVPVFQSTVRLVDQLRSEGIRVGVASSSKNCRPVLRQTNLIERFDAIIDGTDVPRLGIKGKPAPDMFLGVAHDLSAAARNSVVFEDAYVGVEAGKNGEFGLVVGIARNGDTAGLLARGAHIAVNDLEELPLHEIRSRFPD